MKILQVCHGAGKLALQLLFPRRCPVCDEIVRPFGEKICLECMGKLKLLTPPWCMRCGKKVRKEEILCADCRKREHAFVRGRTLYEYSSAAAPIYRLKYGNRREYAEFFGEEMARYLGTFIRQIQPDALIPIPLHRSRLRKRGYNQAYLLAKALGRSMGIPVYDRLVVRIRNTVPMKQLNPQERQNNLKKAFHIVQNDVKLLITMESLHRVILIDDIYTTGSTVDEVASLLREHGVAEVYVIALACGAGV